MKIINETMHLTKKELIDVMYTILDIPGRYMTPKEKYILTTLINNKMVKLK